MLRMERPVERRQMENTITLINIVFLMLIFFLIAGTIAPGSPPDLNTVKTTEAEDARQEMMLGVRNDGTLVYEGAEITAAAYAALARQGAARQNQEPVIRILPDRDLPATRLLEIVSELHGASGAKTIILSERAKK